MCEEATGAGEEQAEGDAEPATNPVPVSQNVGGAAAPGWARKQGNNVGRSRGSERDTEHRTLTVIQYSTEKLDAFLCKFLRIRDAEKIIVQQLGLEV